jgi:sigma-54 dependent transcriptional regulator, acetoin dehydrogenase operon transcriptional activator AcoR
LACFVAVPCAAVTSDELTDAVQRAQNGTLCLDGVGELPPELQAQLLHRLDEPAFGLICASSQALRAGAGPGALREDLFHRLQGLTVTLPPLRQRSDLAALAQRMLDSLGHSGLLKLAPETLAQLASGSWPGNLRQLQRVLHTAALLAQPGAVLEPWHLPATVGAAAALVAVPKDPPLSPALAAMRPSESLEQTERRAMEQALQACGGNISKAARVLGVSRNTLYRRLRGAQTSSTQLT